MFCFVFCFVLFCFVLFCFVFLFFVFVLFCFVFYDCKLFKDFSNRVETWINEKVVSDVSSTRENIFLGYNVTNPPMAINHIILCGKQFIYKCKLLKTIPKFFIFVRNINNFITIECILASNKINCHPLC